MLSTSVSLLQKAQTGSDPAAWRRLHDLYAPLIESWLRRDGSLREQDVADLRQDIMAVLVKHLPRFQWRGAGSFKGWLRAVVGNQVKTWRRQRHAAASGGSDAGLLLAQLEDPASAPSRTWDEEHDRFVLQRLLALIQGDFEPATWEAFRRFTLDGQASGDVARDLGVAVDVVYTAKSRVLARLRHEAAGLVD